MKFSTTFFALASFATFALANVIPRDAKQLELDISVMSARCNTIQSVINGIGGTATSTDILNLAAQSGLLCNDFDTLGNDTKSSGTISIADTQTLLKDIAPVVTGAMPQILNKLGALSSTSLHNVHPQVHLLLLNLQTHYDSSAAKLINACDAADKARAQQLADAPKPAFGAALAAYSSP
ncbi:hypothetical protein D9757_003847 [Collybiopsis confluens]|uniref:Uncharacterized protein n=1 Tax=Collybiopsis confluens TaxID=2823264 RepID=A0A8H5HV29_9AGAR|nr:hypothetical protein D9757_003847 [Collybiopsis confluens]